MSQHKSLAANAMCDEPLSYQKQVATRAWHMAEGMAILENNFDQMGTEEVYTVGTRQSWVQSRQGSM